MNVSLCKYTWAGSSPTNIPSVGGLALLQTFPGSSSWLVFIWTKMMNGWKSHADPRPLTLGAVWRKLLARCWMSGASVIDTLCTTRCWKPSLWKRSSGDPSECWTQTSHCHSPVRPFLIVGPVGCPDLRLQLVALLPVGFLSFTEQFLADFSLFDCVKGGGVDIFIQTKQCCFFWVYSGVLQCRKAPCGSNDVAALQHVLPSCFRTSFRRDNIAFSLRLWREREGGSAFVSFPFCVKCFYRCCF